MKKLSEISTQEIIKEIDFLFSILMEKGKVGLEFRSENYQKILILQNELITRNLK